MKTDNAIIEKLKRLEQQAERNKQQARDYQRKKRESKRKDGLVQVSVWIPKGAVEAARVLGLEAVSVAFGIGGDLGVYDVLAQGQIITVRRHINGHWVAGWTNGKA